jgi:hypothetical protein
MTYTTARTWVAGEVPTAAVMNQHLRDQLDSGVVRPIADQVLSADGPVSFQAIPQTFAHLALNLSGRLANVASYDDVYARFNNDSGANYDAQIMFGLGAGMGAGEQLGATQAHSGWAPAASASAGIFCSTRAYAHHYTGAQQKTWLAQSGRKHTTTAGQLVSGASVVFWRNNSAITQIDIYGGAGGLWVAGTRATLYGIPF